MISDEQTPLLAEASHVASSASGIALTAVEQDHTCNGELYDNVPQSKRRLGWSSCRYYLSLLMSPSGLISATFLIFNRIVGSGSDLFN